MKQKDIWNKQFSKYFEKKEVNDSSVFSYEEEINSPSVLGLCPFSANRVLDLGCGEGSFTHKLFEKYGSVTGVDYSEELLRVARKKFPKIIFVVADLESFSGCLEGKYDLIVSKLTLMYVENIRGFAHTCFESMNKGGSLVVSVTHPVRWLTCYLENKHGVKERKGFANMQGYFSEVFIKKSIDSIEELSFQFINRTVSTYITTFLSAGFVLTGIEEPRMSRQFAKKFPESRHQRAIPLRLNLRFSRGIQTQNENPKQQTSSHNRKSKKISSIKSN